MSPVSPVFYTEVTVNKKRANTQHGNGMVMNKDLEPSSFPISLPQQAKLTYQNLPKVSPL